MGSSRSDHLAECRRREWEAPGVPSPQGQTSERQAQSPVRQAISNPCGLLSPLSRGFQPAITTGTRLAPVLPGLPGPGRRAGACMQHSLMLFPAAGAKLSGIGSRPATSSASSADAPGTWPATRTAMTSRHAAWWREQTVAEAVDRCRVATYAASATRASSPPGSCSSARRAVRRACSQRYDTGVPPQ